jgi:tetratricopeptide (TPR) repeat protein
LKAYTTPDERQAIPVLNHLLAISYLSGNADDAREGLVHSKNVLEHSNMKNNPGALHSAAHLLLILALNDGEAEDKKQSYLNDADVFCEKAIAIEEDRGRYFYTRARIQRAKSDYPQARKYIQHAIEIEDRDAADATLRLTDYMIEESRIESDMLRHQTHEQLSEVQVQHNHMHNELKEIPQQIQMRLDEQAKENEKRMRDAEKLTIGVLGFFAGILSLLQISSQKISQVDSAGDVVAQIGTFALIIGVFIFAGVYLINRGRSSK